MIERAVLADAGPLYAALNRRDQYHERALVELAALAAERRLITIRYPTDFETYSLILKRHSPSVVFGWLEDIAVDAMIVDVEEVDYLRAFETVRRFTDQPMTLFDALMSAYAARTNMHIWTYDHHIDILGALGAERWYPGMERRPAMKWSVFIERATVSLPTNNHNGVRYNLPHWFPVGNQRDAEVGPCGKKQSRFLMTLNRRLTRRSRVSQTPPR